MAQLPTSFNAPHSNISDGSDLIRTAMNLTRDITTYGDKALATISDYAKQQANQALVNTFASNIANGMDPTSAMSGALGKVNSWTSAEAINNLLAQRNYEQESLRKEALLDIQKAQEDRALQDWTGKNEASEANLLLDTGYNTNNSKLYNQGLSKASTLSDIAKKFIKMQNLAEQQDRFATSATSRAYNRALIDNMEDKKLVSQLDARFRVLESQNPSATKTQIAQAVAQEYNLSPDQVNLLLNQYQYASGQSLLKEASSYLSNVLAPKTVETYNKAQANLQNLNVDIQKALNGNTEQNKKDTNTAIDILSKDLSSVIDEEADPALRAAAASIDMPATTKLNEKEAKEIVSSLIKNPSKKNFENIKNKLEAKGYNGHFVDWLNSNFIINNSNTVELSPNTSANINSALNQELIGDRTRGDVVAESQVDLEKANLGINKAAQSVEYANILALTRKKDLTTEEGQKLSQLVLTLNNRNKAIGEQQGRVANAVVQQNPTEEINQTINTFRDIVDSNKIITTNQLVQKGLTETQAEDVVKRIHDVREEAKDSKEYRGIPLEAIEYAVLNNYLDAGSIFTSDKAYLKSAMNILDKIPSKKAQSILETLAQEQAKADALIQAIKHLNGQ